MSKNIQQESNDKDNITISTEKSFKEKLRIEAFKRGHSVSEAGELILKGSYQQYLKKYPPVVSLDAPV